MTSLKKLARVAAVAAALVIGAASAVAAPTIYFGPATDAGGGVIGVDVVVGDLGAQIVSAFDLDVSYDVGALTFGTVLFSNMLGDASFFEAINAFAESGGVVDLAAVSLLSDAELLTLQGGGPVVLATLQFTGSDASSLAFINWGTDLVNNTTNDVKGLDNQVIIPVPEPASYGLAGLALLAAGIARRRAH
ncbi:PEP-CTERM sorting domain-containing protein [Ideonella sp. A 288]|uniref:PEP-CTERM sorting domain-containing protein n=1 Tax=Ideonella sp. A 288 TaxID=1962181 RepID=UPI001185AD61|nr:PEP-CTERM sorting domain-containing protein [Ideonella sp. A 288]